MGWNFINQIAKSFRVIAITRENNLPAIEQYLIEKGESHHANIEFVGYDLPKHLRFWKRGSFGSLPYFYLWQRTMPAFIKRKGFQFDLTHNLNFHNDWTPSFLWKLGKPLVWGPIGHHPQIPTTFLKPFGLKAILKDKLTWAVKKAFWQISPSLKKTAQKSDLVIAMNQSVKEVLPIESKQLRIMPSVGTLWVAQTEQKSQDAFEVISVGRFVPLKGFDLTIKAFSAFYHALPSVERAHVHLRLIGKGPLLDQMKEMVKSLNLEKVVSIVEWVEKAKLESYYRESNVFLFPSHEGAGMVVAEAMSYGLPVVCLDNCGPGEFLNDESGIAVPYQAYDKTIQDLAAALQELYENKEKQQRFSEGARNRFEQYFDWDAKGEELRKMYTGLLKSA